MLLEKKKRGNAKDGEILMRTEEDFEEEKAIIERISAPHRDYSGIHTGKLVVCLRRTYWRETGVPETADDALQVRFALGRVSEDVLDLGEVKQPMKELDGIIRTPDGIDGEWIIEKKRTIRSSNRRLSDFPMWLKECKASCKVFSKNKVKLRVLFEMGDWKRPIKPTIKVWKLYFDNDEIEENWTGLVIMKEELEYCIANRILPDMTGEEWECKSCGYRVLCYGEDEK